MLFVLIKSTPAINAAARAGSSNTPLSPHCQLLVSFRSNYRTTIHLLIRHNSVQRKCAVKGGWKEVRERPIALNKHVP